MTVGYGQLYSQHSMITGQIIDYDTKEPIPGLIVYFKTKNGSAPVDKSTNTDREGKFSLGHISKDTVNLIIEKQIGYSTITTVKNIYATTDTEIGKIFHLQRSDVVCELPDVSDRKARKAIKAIKKNNKITNSPPYIDINNDFISINCGLRKSYKMAITDKIVAIDFKDIFNCQN